MVDFRRLFIAMAVIALFAGLASAQITDATPYTADTRCVAMGSNAPDVRGEGYTERVGDLVISCTGGVAKGDGEGVETADLTLYINSVENITSRLLPTSYNSNASEVLLYLDEPNSAKPAAVVGFGPDAPQAFCGSAYINVGAGVGGCQAYARNVGGITVLAANATGTPTPAKNVFQGVWNYHNAGYNTITFIGIPMLPPGTPGVARQYRMTNIRVDATPLSDMTDIYATAVSAFGTDSLPTTSAQRLARVRTNTIVFNADENDDNNPYLQCELWRYHDYTRERNQTATISFTENKIPYAFKTRVVPMPSPTAQNLTSQNNPDNVYSNKLTTLSPVSSSPKSSPAPRSPVWLTPVPV